MIWKPCFPANFVWRTMPIASRSPKPRWARPRAGKATMARMLYFFGKALGPIINVLDPHAIVLGGGVGNIDLLYSKSARHSVERYVFNQSFDTEILKPTLGDSAGVFGAAMLVAD